MGKVSESRIITDSADYHGFFMGFHQRSVRGGELGFKSYTTALMGLGRKL